ncbi:MAG: BamA/TamA family outer membrane protein [Ignavibacteriales bacterium]|nr:BamA/TamA family outer membrane protein [Ignavibacteriales bacterium]
MSRVALLASFLCFFPSLRAQEAYEVGALRFEGNEILTDDMLLSAIQSHETPWWLWKVLYSKPEYYDPIVFESDVLRLARFYQSNGFFHAHIDTTISFDHPAKRVSLAFFIQEGQRSFIDTIGYKGLDLLPHELRVDVQNNPLVEVGDPFVTERVQAELARVVGLFANYGYVNVKVETPTALRYASTNNVTVKYAFVSGDRYRFGAIDVVQDTSVDERVDTDIVLRHLDFQPGDFYSESRKLESERNLNRLGIFEASRIDHIITDSTREHLDIPIRVSVRSRPFNELTPEVGVNDKDNALNILLGVGYNNRNFLGGARNFSTRLTLQLQDINIQRAFKRGLSDSSIVSYVDLSTQLVQPYFITNKVTLTATLSAILDKQRTYYNPILQGRLGVTAQTATFTRLFVDWNLQRIDPTGFAGALDTTDPDLQRQFNSIITITLQRDKRNDLFSPSEGFIHSITVEEAGFLPSIFGSLLGTDLPYSQYYKISALAQWYWDPTGERNVIWAFKLSGGVAEIYGNPTSPFIPVTRRFFAGGSGSLRGWRARGLGAVPDPDKGGAALFEGNVELRLNPLRNAGEFWVIDLKKISFVLFSDIGNVWTQVSRIRATELAMASGLGFRWDTVAGPIRIDFGMRVYDPFAETHQRWITRRRFFPDTFVGGVLHFGIGHSF